MTTMAWTVVLVALLSVATLPARCQSGPDLRLLPYPQEVEMLPGRLALGPCKCITEGGVSAVEQVAIDSLRRYLPKKGARVRVRLGSVEEGYDESWIEDEDRAFLGEDNTSPEASVLKIAPDGITIVGKGRLGMLYAAQTVNQLVTDARRDGDGHLPCVAIRDWPDMEWRCLSPQMTWYSGYNRLEGYDTGNWALDEWKWLVDWTLLHKFNCWAFVLCGYWPMTLPGYESQTLDVDSYFYNPATGRKEPWRFTHRNIKNEFLPELIQYANARGVQVYMYSAINSFNGVFWKTNPEMNAGGAAELLPFAPGVHEYWDACLKRLLEIGFNGFVFENPEAHHVPNQNQECYDTFWAPWAEKYGFTSVEDTDQNDPPLGVHVEYYAWMIRVWDEMIQAHARAMGIDTPVDVFIISHILMSRVIAESADDAERQYWFDLIDQRIGRRLQFIVVESNEDNYVRLLGADRVASLGGRGGSCTCAMRRIASVNNSWVGGPMGATVSYERDCQRHIFEAGGRGAMGYVFEWANTEVFGYIASQYLWRNSGVPGIDNTNDTDFLKYCYQFHYGDEVGELVARAIDEGSCVNDAMVLEGVYGSQYPSTGKALHRDHQLLAALADHAAELARRAYGLYAGGEPDLYRPVYRPEAFRWNGFAARRDRRFKSETLRKLCVSAARSQQMCECALAHRLAMRLIAEGAPLGAVLEQLDRAVDAAKANQLLYQVNYDDDYDWTDGLCHRVTDTLTALRRQIVSVEAKSGEIVQRWEFAQMGDVLGWTMPYDIENPSIVDGALMLKARGPDPFVTHAGELAVDVSQDHALELEMTSSTKGTLQVYWSQQTEDGPSGFSEAQSELIDISESDDPVRYRSLLSWQGVLTNLRVDIPDDSTVGVHAIRIAEIPLTDTTEGLDLDAPVSESAQSDAGYPQFASWEKQTDILPDETNATESGAYISVDLGLSDVRDYYRLGVVFSVQVEVGGEWRTLLRRCVGRRSTGWEHWDVPLGDVASGALGQTEVRFVTDSYTRAQDRGWPTWQWALWGRPELVRVHPDGSREVLYSFADHASEAHPFVRLDSDGLERPFDAPDRDSTGATFRRVEPGPLAALRAGEGRDWQWVEGFTTALSGGRGPYRSYLGSVESWWCREDVSLRVHPEETGEVTWVTAPVPEKRETAVVFIGGTDYAQAAGELACEGRRLLGFEIGNSADSQWQEGDVELRYYHGGDTRDATTTFGLSGVFVLRLPADLVTPGQPLRLTVRMLSGGFAWFMLHGYGNALDIGERSILPDPAMPAIAAFTPHENGACGVTGADYEVALGEGG